jgi:two-component system, chemotaxis family, protein-glutamate methylesterase/glutaminase
MGIEDETIRDEKQLTVIAIGASAGGLSALSAVLHPMPLDLPAPIIIVQHLAPHSISILHQILQRTTHLKVKQAEDGEQVLAGVVYIAPPDSHLVVREGCLLHLEDTQLVHYVRPSADVLFQSLAEEFTSHVIAVVLTGSGIDGTQGAQAIKEAGGIVIVQDEQTSEFWGMPRSVVRAHAADYVLPLSDITPKLLTLISTQVMDS